LATNTVSQSIDQKSTSHLLNVQLSKNRRQTKNRSSTKDPETKVCGKWLHSDGMGRSFVNWGMVNLTPDLTAETHFKVNLTEHMLY